MTAKERAELRDKVTRAQLGLVSPQRGDASGDGAVDGAIRLAPPATTQAPRPHRKREPKYPVTGVASIIECPVHQLVVALDEHGRIKSRCPACLKEAGVAA